MRNQPQKTSKFVKQEFFCTQMLNSLKVRFATIIDQERNNRISWKSNQKS